jgi:uridine kinase
MAYKLREINDRCQKDAGGFIEECDGIYAARISDAAERIMENMKRSPIVLLSGPSGSGKTTTAMKIAEELARRGVNTHSISMDNYFRTVKTDCMPRTPDGAPDLESPFCLDMELLNEHFSRLTEGEHIAVPKFEFARQMRIQKPSQILCLKKDEVAVFEGIHALNDDITNVHPEAFKLYISARSNIEDDTGKVVFKGTWMRLCRRAVRDYLFRGTAAAETLKMWATVRRGEKLYISPYKHKADLRFDSSFAYEVPVLRSMAADVFKAVPEGAERYEELKSILPAFALFEDVKPELLAPDSLLREFIGGGKYQY